MTEAQEKFLNYIVKHVGQPYIWGAEGQTLTKTNYISFIEKNETNGGYSSKLSYKQAAKAFCDKLFSKGQTKLTVFDCSGYVSKALIFAGLLDKRRDCDGIWAKCVRTSKPADFTLLYRVNSRNAEDETHIGVYIGGYQYHAKGRKYGVVKEKYRASYWHKMGVYPGLSRIVEGADGYIFTRLLRSPMINSRDVMELKKLLIKKGYKGITATNGNYLSSTEAVVMQFQRDAGLKVDGKAGRDTITALGGVWNG